MWQERKNCLQFLMLHLKKVWGSQRNSKQIGVAIYCGIVLKVCPNSDWRSDRPSARLQHWPSTDPIFEKTLIWNKDVFPAYRATGNNVVPILDPVTRWMGAIALFSTAFSQFENSSIIHSFFFSNVKITETYFWNEIFKTNERKGGLRQLRRAGGGGKRGCEK